MKVKFWGTRGSTAISNRNSVEVGGNTTCVTLESQCLPNGTLLCIDAGTGFVPMGMDAVKRCFKSIFMLMTHYHHDHTGGMLLSPPIYIDDLNLDIWGPLDGNFGPKTAYCMLMSNPMFPVEYELVGSHLRYKDIKVPQANVIMIHPEGGYKMFPMDQFKTIIKGNRMFPIGKGRYPREECITIFMFITNHPNKTVSYRIEEGPTGKVFVFLTDHENTGGISTDLRRHLQGADLAAIDCQYDPVTYRKGCVGFGHATPDYVAKIAYECGVKELKTTHHDPWKDDAAVAVITQMVKDEVQALRDQDSGDKSGRLEVDKVSSCYDYEEVTV